MATLMHDLRLLFDISHARGIARRYFVVNGFDGALTMMGLIVGFLVSAQTDLTVIINACLGAATALGMSGVSSGYVSEAAESKHNLEKLEQAMITDLEDTNFGTAMRRIPWIIAIINGAAPFLISIVILIPLFLSNAGVSLPVSPLHAAIIVSLILLFLLGVFLGRVAGIFWLRSGMQTLLIAATTSFLIYLMAGG